MVRTPIVDHIKEEGLRERTAQYQSIDRIAEPVEFANLVAFPLSDDPKFISGVCYEIMEDGPHEARKARK